jgi:uncharacterized protein
MKRGLAAVVIVIGLVARAAWGQSPAKESLAEELLQLMHVKENTEKSFEAVKQMLPMQMEKIRDATGQEQDAAGPTNQVSGMIDMIAREMSWENMKNDYIALYAETFTEDELRGMIAFYKTPVGQSWISKQPEVARRSMELGQRLMMRLMPRMQSPRIAPHAPQPPAHIEKPEEKGGLQK